MYFFPLARVGDQSVTFYTSPLDEENMFWSTESLYAYMRTVAMETIIGP